jgi:hypothetical protein
MHKLYGYSSSTFDLPGMLNDLGLLYSGSGRIDQGVAAFEASLGIEPYNLAPSKIF